MSWRGGMMWASLVPTALVLLLYVANVPFYAGSSLGPDHRWRMEHGRLTLRRARGLFEGQGFFVAHNTEGLRFTFDWRRGPDGSWSLTLPLWAPLLIGSALTALFAALLRKEGPARART